MICVWRWMCLTARRLGALDWELRSLMIGGKGVHVRERKSCPRKIHSTFECPRLCLPRALRGDQWKCLGWVLFFVFFFPPVCKLCQTIAQCVRAAPSGKVQQRQSPSSGRQLLAEPVHLERRFVLACGEEDRAPG